MHKFRLNGFVKLAAIAFIHVCIVIIISNKINSNELAARKAELEERVALKTEEVGALQHRLDTPFDADFITMLAKEKLNLVMPDVTVFYNDLAK